MSPVENILATFERATLADIAEGMFWYADAHNLARELSPNDVWRGAGVISAFSPQREWCHNMRTARQAFATGIATGHTGAMNAQAQRILDGEPTLDVLKGDKVRSFAEAIATNGKGSLATIDRHAHDVAMSRVYADKERKIGKRVFRELAQAYADAARMVGCSVNELQAITWVTWKREKGLA